MEDLNEKEQQTYFGASPESLLEDASIAESIHAMNSTTRRVMEKLQPFVAAIEQYGEAVNVYSSTYSLALAPIWGSIKVLLHVGFSMALNRPAMLIRLSSRLHVNLANTLTSLWTCLQGSAMSYPASKLMRDFSRTMSV